MEARSRAENDKEIRDPSDHPTSQYELALHVAARVLEASTGNPDPARNALARTLARLFSAGRKVRPRSHVVRDNKVAFPASTEHLRSPTRRVREELLEGGSIPRGRVVRISAVKEHARETAGGGPFVLERSGSARAGGPSGGRGIREYE